jgi:hypothetical protein
MCTEVCHTACGAKGWWAEGQGVLQSTRDQCRPRAVQAVSRMKLVACNVSPNDAERAQGAKQLAGSALL